MKKLLSTIVLAATLVGTMTAAKPAEAASTYAQTKYPIVLVHGWLGWDAIAGVDYFYKIPGDLRNNGAKVYVAYVSGNNSTELRGEQLLQQVQQILAVSGAKKVNLIGHSHGSPTSRYVAGVRPDLVASVTSVGGVNKGSDVADAVSKLDPNSTLGMAAIGAVNTIGKVISAASGHPELAQDALGTLTSLSSAGALAFNAKFPAGIPTTACGEGAYAVNGIQFYSWSGGQATSNLADPIDYAFSVTNLLFNGKKNDGLVSTCSSHLGKVIRDDYAYNHMDEVNQFFGLTNVFGPDPIALFRAHANRLKNAGL